MNITRVFQGAKGAGALRSVRTRLQPWTHKGFEYYKALEKRDRLALLGLGVFLTILIVYFGLWSPVNRYLEESKAYHDRQQSLLQYMRSTEQQARNVAGSAEQQVVGGQTLLTQVSRTAQQFGIKPNRLQPEGNNSVSVWFNSVGFNEFARWLEQLTRQQNVSIKQISIDREGEPGKVNARIVLGE